MNHSYNTKGGESMFVDHIEREEMADARLARTHPVVYEAKMKAMAEYNPIKDLVSFFKGLFSKMRK